MFLLHSVDPSRCLIKEADHVAEGKYGCLQLTNGKIYLIMVLKIAFKYDLCRKHVLWELFYEYMVTFFGLVFAQHEVLYIAFY